MEQPFGHTQVPIAIVGMACRLPGADNLDQYWDLLSRGGSAVGELPPERLDQELYYDPKVGTRGKSYAKLGSIVSSRQFDNRACPISAELERGVDNAHLLMCQTAAQACRHAGMDPFNLPLRNTGVYIGHAQGSSLAGDLIYGTCIEEGAQFLREVSGFADLPQAEQDAIIQELVDSVRSQLPKRSADSPDVSINMVAGTISKAFQLSGPFLGLNSACASSLQTVMVAARALQLGRIDMAIVGGASDCKGDSLVLFSQAQSMSSTGTRPFDADADGLICAEGYVALVLKTLPRALADGDPIQAIVLGAGMSSDGKGKSLWAPRKEGQVKAMERAYRNGLDMGSLQYIEAHATSTSLGDATELNSLADILADKFTPGKKIPVASVKANIGHALEAAGVSSLIKTVLCLQHRTFVPAINIKALNTKIDWEKVPFYVPLQAAPWPEQPDGLPRRAGVNAFGIGGLNMHVVLEEFTEERRARLREMWPASTIPRAGGAASEDEQAVAIIGMGCILPGADHPAKLWDLIASGRDPKGPTPAGRWRTDIGHEPGAARAYRTPSILGGYITEYAYDWRKHKQPPKQVQQADPLQFMLLDTADQALVDAGYDKKNFDRTRVGVLVGTEFGGDFSTQLGLGLRLPHIASLLKPMLARRGTSAADAERITDELAEVMLKHWPALIDESGSFSTSTLASRITKTMNLMGGAAAIDASNTSSAAALAIATDILVSGDCDMMICAGGQRCMNLPQYEGLALAGSLASGDHPPAPFDATATGIVPGEGVAVVLLKRLGDARRDGDKIHAIIRGIGAAHAEAAEQSIELAINRAMENARVDPADVALVEMDGTGLPERDQDQVCALIATYGKSKRAEPLLVSSITGQIGHTIGASAMVSLVKASLEVEKGQMHATVGLKTPLPVVSQNSGQIQAVTAPLTVRHTSRDGRRLAAVSSYGKGLAYHILLERGEKVAPSQRAEAPTSARQPLAAASPAVSAPPMSAAAECKILRLGAATAAELTAKIERALADPTRAFGEPTEFVAADRLRLGVVASSADALAKKLQIAAKQFANPDAQPVLDQQGCFYRRLPVRRPRVAFVFPGQGSQYPGMLRELVRDVPAAMTAMQEIDAVMQARGYQTFGQMAWERPEQLGADIWVTQVVMLLADLIVHRSLVDMQIQPDLVTGHSYGEFAALTAAGVWDFEGVLTAARARYEAIRAISGARGTMMATNAPAALVEQTAARLANRPYIANYNAPDQTVVGGTPEVLAQLAEQLTAARHKCQMLPVPCPFHTPLMEGVGPLLKRTLDTLRMRPPRVPMLSSITNRYVAEPDDIRANLAAQLTTPVRYVDLVERIVNEQDTVFVEVGPQQALTKLNRRILEKRSVAGVVACDNPKYPGLEPLYHVRALAECLGLVPSESRIAEKVQVGGASQPASVVGAVRPAAASQPPGKQPTEIANARSNTVDQSKPKRGTITHVDATERRIAKMRQKAADGGRTSNGKSGEPTAPSRAEPALPSGNGPAGASRISPAPQPAVSKPAAPAQVSRPAMPVTPAPPPAMSAPRAASPTRPIPAASHSGVANAAQAPPAASGLNAAELEKFLVNFVVEQTGYPPEVVELDADMEADLGIDSIKKAQLFGELAEYFDVQPGENLTLDDFPTLRHVMSFLVGASAKSSAVSNGAAASVAPAPARAVKAAASTRSMAPTAVPTPAPAATGGLNPAELEKFLVNFVVEQTGYPPEVVELDADMEADLGIDSIKKAQLFGELAEYFDVQPGENLTLDDFPTLRHVMNFLVGASAKSSVIGNGAAASMAPAPAPAARAAASTPSTAPAAVAIQAPAAAGGLNPAELEKFLVNFVVEQTGYPPEVVELDADMEADLGIDSIKKAQLFGELAEYFDVQPGENLTLDDFPTLRHVMNFLVGSDLKKKLAAGPSEPSSPCLTDPGPVCSPLAEAAQAEPELAAVATIAAQATPITSGELLILAGTRYEMGLAHGRHKKDEIRRILRRYADLAGAEIEELPLDARSLADPSRAFSSEELDELKGIAAGAGVLFSNIVAHNLAVAADFGNSTLQAAGAGGLDGAGGLLHVSSSDLPLLSALADCVEPVMQVRTPAGGIPHVALSVVGTCGSLGGVNAHGLAVTVGGHTTGPGGAARTGAHVLVAGNLLARADSIASAQTLAKSLPADSVWSAILSEAATGQMCAFECDGRTAAVHPNRDKQVLSATSQAGSQERLNAFASVLSSGASAHDAAERLMARWNPNADEARNEEAPRVDLIIDAARGQLWVGKSGRGFEQFLIRDLLRPPVVPLAPKVQPEVESPPFDLGTEEHYQTHRFCLRPRAMPFKPSVPEMPEWQGAALIVGQNEMSRALRRLLESAGVVVRELPETDDVDAAVAALEQIWREQAVPHLFITTGRDEESGDRSDVDVWNRRWRRVALVPYFLCQKWVQLAGSANMLDRTTLVATTRLNGNFGFEGELLAPECGALTGLMKAIYIEVGWMRNNRNMLLKAIDAPDDELVDQLAANICRELASKTVDYEVAFVRGQRFLQYAYPQPAPTKTHADVRVGGTWVITGGARGITAECALALGRRFRLKLHLVGASPLPHLDERMRNLSTEELKALKTTVMREARAAGRSMDGEWNRVQREIEIDQALRRFADAGVEATYHQCDVADAAALERVLDAVRRSSGPIEGIVHGAGIERAASYERKSRDAVLATLGAKVDGAMHLIRLTRNDPVRHFVGFGSVSGRLGSNGQTDYCLASDTLCKLASWYKHVRPGVQSVSFHWHPWADIGMAARPESAAMLRITDGPTQMPKEEGVSHFLRELYADAPESEVLITTWEYHGRYYGTEHHPKAGAEQSSPLAVAEEPWEPFPVKAIASRHELKLVSAPLPASARGQVRWEGAACVLGDNPAAQALADRLVAEGVVVHRLTGAGSVDEAVHSIEALYHAQPFRYLFLMTGRDENLPELLDRAGWQARRSRGVDVPYLAAQHWFRLRMRAKDKTPVTIVAATSLGGDFGLSHQVANPEGGAMTGMLKSIFIEDSRTAEREVRVKAIDLPADEPPTAVAEAICRELAGDDPNVEVAYQQGRRSVLRSLVVPVESYPKRKEIHGGTWVVTGGARGITAAAALELGKRFGLKLHLIGRSPAPQPDAPWRGADEQQLSQIKAQVVKQAVNEGRSPEKDWERIKNDMEIDESLRRFAAAGVNVGYHSCDLADWDRLAATLEDIRRADGPIEGIVHGAGYGKSFRFGTRSRDVYERTLAGKLDGAVALMSLTMRDPLRYFLGFGSIGGRFGGNGLSDYAAANDMFAKLCAWFHGRRPDCGVGCLEWQSWDEVGMAMLGDSAVGTKGVLKMDFISPAEGIEHLCRELRAGLPTTEVVITDGFFERTFFPFAVNAASAGEPSTGKAELGRVPLVEKVQTLDGGPVVESEISFEPGVDPFLLDHQLRGRPLLPAVMALEAMAETASIAGGTPVSVIRDVQLIHGFVFQTERTMPARVRATPQGAEIFECELLSDFRNRAGKLIKKDRVHVRATVDLADRRPALAVAMGQPPSEWRPFEFQNIGPLYHGPSLHGVRATNFNEKGGWGQLVALSLGKLGGPRRAKDWIVPATLLDAAFYVCGVHSWFSAEGAFSLPSSLEAVRLGRMPHDDEPCLMNFVCREVTSSHAIYDFDVFGADGQALLRVEGHRVVMIKP